MKKSYNNKLMLEPYMGENKIKAEVSTGFAKIRQKSSLIGLKLVMDAVVFTPVGELLTLNKGQICYFEEESLFSQEWSKKIIECSGVDVKFVMGDFSQVRIIE